MVMSPDIEVPIDVPMEFPNGAEVIDDGMGGAIVQSMEEMPMDIPDDIPFDANLAEYLDDGVLGEISSDLRGLYEEDLESRSDWEETYTKGLDLLGLKAEERTTPFEGASGIVHPMISESVTQFQAQAYKELLPAGGPVRTRLMGLQDQAREDQANRVEHFYELPDYGDHGRV